MLATVGACSDGGDEGILVVKNVVPQIGCTFTGDSSELAFATGEVNIHTTEGYLFAPQMQSRVISSMDDVQSRTVITTGANVDIEFADSTFGANVNADPALTHFNQPFSVPLAPIVNDSPSVADGSFTLIPQQLVDAIGNSQSGAGSAGAAEFSTLLLVDVQVLGTMSGNDVSSQKFTYGVTVGNKIVVQELGACPVTNGLVVNPGNACNVFQDGQVGCCRDTTNPDPINNLVCPAPTQ
jgi:hypothetical protein|nr:hypothetical protein [Kofleriaceae bacterium]